MRFRKNEIICFEIQIFIFICLIVSVILMLHNSSLVSILMLPSILLLGVFIVQPSVMKEYITIDENGIICKKGKNLCWEYKWSQIAELRIGKRFRNPSIEILLKSDCCDDKAKVDTTAAYFQLGLSAKKAIKNYCKCPITKN